MLNYTIKKEWRQFFVIFFDTLTTILFLILAIYTFNSIQKLQICSFIVAFINIVILFTVHFFFKCLTNDIPEDLASKKVEFLIWLNLGIFYTYNLIFYGTLDNIPRHLNIIMLIINGLSQFIIISLSFLFFKTQYVAIRKMYLTIFIGLQMMQNFLLFKFTYLDIIPILMLALYRLFINFYKPENSECRLSNYIANTYHLKTLQNFRILCVLISMYKFEKYNINYLRDAFEITGNLGKA